MGGWVVGGWDEIARVESGDRSALAHLGDVEQLCQLLHRHAKLDSFCELKRCLFSTFGHNAPSLHSKKIHVAPGNRLASLLR